MADHGADAAVVHGIVGRRIEERRPQDCGREHDLVHGRVVIGIDGLRRHQPLVTLERTAELGGLSVELELAGAAYVADQIVTPDRERAVVAPAIRIADLHRDLRELAAGFFLGRGAHPLERIDRLCKRPAQVFHQRDHARLGLGRKRRLHIQLADQLAHGAVHRLHRTLPARLRLLHARDRALVELEMRALEIRGEVRRVGIEHAELEIQAPVRHRHHADQPCEFTHIARLVDVEHRRAPVEACAFEQRLPIEAGRKLRGGSEIHAVVGAHGIAIVDAAPVMVREAALQRSDAFRARGGVPIASERQQFLHVGLELDARPRAACVRLQVIVTVRHRQAALIDAGQVDARVLRVLADVELHGVSHTAPLQSAYPQIHVTCGADACDAREIFLQRLHAQYIDARGIEEAGVEIADLLLIGTGRGTCRGGRLHDRAHRGFRLILELCEGAVVRAIRRDGRAVEPAPRSKCVEVVLRAHSPIEAVEIEAGPQRRQGGGCGARRGRRVARRRHRAGRQQQRTEECRSSHDHSSAE